MNVRFRRRFSLVLALLCVVSLASCARSDDTPRARSSFTLGPDSSENTQKAPTRAVCSLLTADERQALAGRTMNVVVPVSPAAGTQECQWVHSLDEASSSTIRLVAFSTHDWAKVANRQFRQAMDNPKLSASKLLKLQRASTKLAQGTSKLTDNQICDLYWLLAQSSGFHKGSEVVFSSLIGRMRAGYATGCGDGVLTLLGYGEYGLRTSIPLYTALIDLRKTVQERASEKFGDKADKASDEPSDQPSDEPSEGASATASTGPTHKPTTEASSSESADSGSK